MLRQLTGFNRKDVYKNITHLILDEIHEHEARTDILLITIKDAIQENPNLKIILMSATLDAQKFIAYFKNCPVVDVPGRMFDVEVIYLNALLLKINFQTEEMAVGGAIDLTNDLISNAIDHELLNHLIKYIHNETSADESILVFLSGYDDIMQQKIMIESRCELSNYELFVLHSGVNTNDHSSVFQRMKKGVRKIILSTNIAETSLTINDVVSC